MGVVTHLAIVFDRPGFVWCPRGRPAGSHRAQCVPDAGNSWDVPVWCLWSRGSCPAPRPADAPDHTHCCSDVWSRHLLSTHSVTGSRKHTHTHVEVSRRKQMCSIIPLQKAINNKHGSNTPTHTLSNTAWHSPAPAGEGSGLRAEPGCYQSPEWDVQTQNINFSMPTNQDKPLQGNRHSSKAIKRKTSGFPWNCTS